MKNDERQEAPSDSTAIPLIVAVCGHRDLVPEDIPQIRVKLRQALELVERSARRVPLILLTGLAEGADQLVAEEALDRQWNVTAALPMPLADYLEDFAEGATRDAFLRIQRRCRQTVEMPWIAPTQHDHDIDSERDQQYRNQGIFLVRHAQLVIALWDGQPQATDATSGTAYVVDLCRNGPPPVEGEILASPETTSLIQIPVRRRAQPATLATPATEVPSDKLYKNVIKEFSRFNVACRKYRRVNAGEILVSLNYLIPADVRDTLEPRDNALIAAYADANSLSIGLRRRRDHAVAIVSCAVVMGAFFQATYGAIKEMPWLIAYAGAAALAYGLYIFLFKLPLTQVGDRYIEYRAVAEGLRVQLFWQLSGVNYSVAEHYQYLIKTEVGWIREALRNMQFLANPELSWKPLPRPAAVQALTRRFWIDDQEKYFLGTKVTSGKAAQCKSLKKGFDIAAGIALGLGAILVAVAGSANFMSIPPEVKAAASAFSASFFLLGGVIKGYASAMGYAEQAVSYEMMGSLFRNARAVLDKFAGDLAIEEQCLFALGKFALAENASWLLMNRKNAFKVQN